MRIRGVIVFFALGLPASLLGQTLKTDCVRDSAEAFFTTGPWANLRPSVVKARLQPVWISGQMSAIADSLRAIYSRAPADLSALTAAQRDAIFAELDTLDLELTGAERDPSVIERGAITDRFALDFDPGPPAKYTLFFGRRTAQPTITDSVPAETRRSVCWLAFAGKDATSPVRERGFDRLAAALHELDTRWDNFMNRGYSMLPHEVLINGWIPRRELTPPDFQVIVVHPSAATQLVGASWRTLRDSRREDVLTVEPLGFVFYYKQNSRFLGASWALTFPGTGRMGSGIMAHIGELGHVGYIWRPRDPDGKDRDGLLVSIDLYQYLTDAAGKWKSLQTIALADCRKAVLKCVEAVNPKKP